MPSDKSQHLYQEIAADLIAKIESGEYPRGSKLPGREELAAHYGTTPITVRAAQRLVWEQGLLLMKQGTQPIVLSPQDSGRPPEVLEKAPEPAVEIRYELAALLKEIAVLDKRLKKQGRLEHSDVYGLTRRVLLVSVLVDQLPPPG